MENNVIIYGYTAWYAVKPKIEVYKDDELIGEVSYQDTFEFNVEEDCVLKFKCSVRKAEIKEYKDKINKISLEFNRFTGQLKAKYK